MTTNNSIPHTELFHYTTIAGLHGIIQSQVLWATHAAYLNDGEEIKLFESRVPAILTPYITPLVDPELVKEYGSATLAARGIASDISASIYKVLLGTSDKASAISDPYIASFCTAATPDIARHGLLSQWRGYGRDGGYAIVFDPRKLEDLLRQEGEKWNHLFSGNVVYSNEPDAKIIAELGDDMEAIASNVAEYLRSDDDAALGNSYDPLIRCASRYKHWGFHEEREFRIIGDLLRPELSDHARGRGVPTRSKPTKYFTRGGTLIPTVHLFDGITRLPDQPLPITRIIVGPHPDHRKRQQAVQFMLAEHGLDIPVQVSEIPYIGQAQ